MCCKVLQHFVPTRAVALIECEAWYRQASVILIGLIPNLR